MTFKKQVALIDAHIKRIGRERDKLDETITHLQDILNDCDEALEDLQRARDALSRWA